MKKLGVLLLGSMLCMILVACSDKALDPSTPANNHNASDFNSKEVMKAKIIKHNQDTLLVAKQNGEDFDLYTLSTDVPIISDEKLTEGAIIEIGYDGLVQEIYPAIIPNIDYIKFIEQGDDLVGFYEEVFLDLLEKDSALNDGIDFMALDLEKTENLSASEKHALKYVLGITTGIQTTLGTYDELVKEKVIHIDEETGFATFEKGLLLSLETSEIKENQFKFNATKWRSSLGAYSFFDCTATKEDNNWSYTIGSEAIS